MASWGIVLQAVVVMSIAFLLLGSFGLLALQVESVLQHWESEAPVLLYVKDGISPIQKAQLEQSLQKIQEVQKIRWITPKQSMARMKKAMGKKGKLLDSLDTPLLPTTIEIDLKQWARTPTSLKEIKVGLGKLPGIQEVDIGQRWFAPLWELVKWVRIILFGGSALLLLSACLIAAGTIRLALHVHKDEIEIMRLLGATEHFIRMPFYLEGAVKGIFAASLSLGVLYGVFTMLSAQYGPSFLAFTSIPLRFFEGPHIALFVMGGFLSGCTGSWLAFLSSPTRGQAHSN